MGQKFSVTMFVAGLPTFLATATEIISNGHNQWSYFYSTPLGALHFFMLGASFVAMIAGALGTQIPRVDAGTYADRKTDVVVSMPPPTNKS